MVFAKRSRAKSAPPEKVFWFFFSKKNRLLGNPGLPPSVGGVQAGSYFRPASDFAICRAGQRVCHATDAGDISASSLMAPRRNHIPDEEADKRQKRHERQYEKWMHFLPLGGQSRRLSLSKPQALRWFRRLTVFFGDAVICMALATTTRSATCRRRDWLLVKSGSW